MRLFLLTICVFAVTTQASLNDTQVGPTARVDRVDQPGYAFYYAVSDSVTRDNKAQRETRDGDVVKGSYSVADPDGSLRVVDYIADARAGFNALVKNLGPSTHNSPLVHTPLTPFANSGHKSAVTTPFAPTISPTLSVVPQMPIKSIVPNTLIMPLLPKSIEPLIPLVGPLSYGFGGAPIIVAYPKVPLLKRRSLPWDPFTSSFGGWRPVPGHSVESKPHVHVFTTQYKNGILHKWEDGPIPFRTLVIQKKH